MSKEIKYRHCNEEECPEHYVDPRNLQERFYPFCTKETPHEYITSEASCRYELSPLEDEGD